MSNTTLTRLAHQRLDAYHVALELFQGVERVAAMVWGLVRRLRE